MANRQSALPVAGNAGAQYARSVHTAAPGGTPMKSRFVPLALCAGLAFACRPAEEKPQPKTQPMAPILARPATPAVQAEKPAAAPVAPSDARAERIAALSKEHSDAMNAYYAAFQAALGDNKNPTQEDYRKVQETVHAPDT